MKMDAEKSEKHALSASIPDSSDWQKRLEFIESQANLGSWEYSPATGKFIWSAQMSRLFSLAPSIVEPDIQAFADFFHPQDQLSFLSAFNSLKNGKIPASQILRSNPERGSQLYLLAGYSLEKSVVDQSVKFLGTLQDVTSRKLEEERLHASENTLKLFVENAPSAIAMFDRNMVYIAASRRFYIDYDIQEQDIIGKSHYEIFPEISQRVREIHRRCLAGATERAVEDSFLRKDGSIDWVNWEVRPWFESDHSIGGIILFSEVVTAQKQAADELKKSEKKFRTLFEQASDGILLANKTGHILDVNSHFCEMLGYSKDEFLQLTIYDLVPQEEVDRIDPAIQKLLKKGHTKAEWKLRRKDTTVLFGEATASKLGDGFLQAFVHDITERKQNEARVMLLNRLYATLSQINQALVRIHDKQTLYTEICREAVEFGQFRMAWFGEIDPIDNMVKPIIFEGAENGYLNNIKISVDDINLAEGPTGRAIDEKKCVICQDISTDPKMKPWRDQAIAHGFYSSASVPVFLNQQPIGAFTVYAAEPQSFTQEDATLLDRIGQNISFALDNIQAETERQKAEEALRESEILFSATFHSNSNPIFMLDATNYKYLEANEAFFRSTGFSRAEVIGHNFRDLHLWKYPTQREKIKQILTAQEPVVDIEVEIYKKNGNIGTYLVSVEKLDQVGKHYFLIIANEITERLNYENELQFRNNLLSAQQEASIDGILVADGKNQIISYNRRFTEMWNIPENLIAEKKSEVVLQLAESQVTDPKSFRNKIHYLNENPQESGQDEIKLIDGRYFDRYSAPVNDQNGHYYARIWYYHDVTEHKQSEREIRHQSEDLMLINALNEAANRGDDVEEILSELAIESKQIFSAQDAALFLLSPDKKYLVLQTSTVVTSKKITRKIEKLIGMQIPKIIVPATPGNYMHAVLTKGEGSLLTETSEIEEWIKCFTETISLNPGISKLLQAFIPQIRRILNINSVILVPLISSGKLIGLLDTTSKTPLTQEDLHRIENISRQVTASILRKEAEKRVRVQLKRINALNEIERAINSSLDLHLILDILVKRVRSQLQVDATEILLMNQYNHTLELVSSDGFLSGKSHWSDVRLGHGLAGQVGLERKMIYISDLPSAEEKYDYNDEIKIEEFIEYVGMPLISKGRLLGVLNIFHRTHFNPDEDWMNYLEMLGGEAAIAIGNAESFEDLQQSNRELSIAYDATIAGWSHAMDMRDKETEGHTIRVTELTLKLAEILGIDAAELSQIRRGALLHDIGKLGVPDNILLKPGPLTDDEWEIMRKHPNYAMEMLSNIEYLRPAIDIPYCHHEKWDGTGYPRGLKGEEIPFAARLFSIVDVWDALTSSRPYRPAWKKEKVIAYIRENSGKAFDPKIVDVFLDQIIAENS